MSRLARERIDDALPGSLNGPHGEGLAWHHKPKPNMLTIGQAAARTGITPARCAALLRRWGIEQRDDSVRAIVGPDLYRRLQLEVRSGQ